MLYIKNGRIHTASFSFVLPEGMSIDTQPYGCRPDLLVLNTLDKEYTIEIGACRESSAQEALEEWYNEEEYVPMTDFFDVVRDGMKGKAFYLRTNRWRDEYYEERLMFRKNFDNQNCLCLSINHVVSDESKRNGIPNFMAQPNIKTFLDSIRYDSKFFDYIGGVHIWVVQ